MPIIRGTAALSRLSLRHTQIIIAESSQTSATVVKTWAIQQTGTRLVTRSLSEVANASKTRTHSQNFRGNNFVYDDSVICMTFFLVLCFCCRSRTSLLFRRSLHNSTSSLKYVSHEHTVAFTYVCMAAGVYVWSVFVTVSVCAEPL